MPFIDMTLNIRIVRHLTRMYLLSTWNRFSPVTCKTDFANSRPKVSDLELK